MTYAYAFDKKLQCWVCSNSKYFGVKGHGNTIAEARANYQEWLHEHLAVMALASKLISADIKAN